MENYSLLMHEFLNIGEAMLKSGAEINRVEDTLCRLGNAYGAKQCEVLAITPSLIVTMRFKESEITQTRRISKTDTMNLSRIEDFNNLSRKCSETPLTVKQLKDEVSAILSKKPSDIRLLLGYILATSAFCLFFGGGIIDGLAAGAVAVILFLLNKFFAPLCPNPVFYYFCASLFSGLIIGGICAIAPILAEDKIVMGVIMPLVPGVAITTAIRSMLVGDTISGTMKLVESLLWAGAMAAGFMLALFLTGGGL